MLAGVDRRAASSALLSPRAAYTNWFILGLFGSVAGVREAGSAEHISDTLYCACGQAETLIKLHKTQLKSDRTSCRSANANQMRLILHTAAYWLMWSLRQALPQTTALRSAEFATLRLRLIKVAARIIETASRIRVALASACPDAALFRHVAVSLRAASP